MLTIKELCIEAHKTALEHGWWENNRTEQEAILMIIVELAEAVQKDRSNDRDGYIEELADVFIRLGDLIGYIDMDTDYAVDIEKIILKKMEYNKTRPYKHGKKY